MTDVMRQSGQAARGGGNRDVMRRERKETFYLKTQDEQRGRKDQGTVKGTNAKMRKKRNLLLKIDELSVVE